MCASTALRVLEPRLRKHAGAAHLTIVALGVIGLACGFPRRCAAQAEDLSGRVVDRAGKGVSGAKIWAIGGDWETPETIATATTGVRGYFVFPNAWGSDGPQVARFVNVFARDGDGRVGWRGNIWWNSVVARELTIVLVPVGQIMGRLNDQDGRPIAGAELVPIRLSLPAEELPGQELLLLSDDLRGPLRTKTGADGSFVLDGIPPGSSVVATIAAPGFGKPQILWDSSRPVSIVLDGRLGRVEGRLKPSGDRKFSGTALVSLRRKTSPENRVSDPFQVFYSRTVPADQDRAFRFDLVPPGRYEVVALFGGGSPVEKTGGLQEVDVGPNAVVSVGMLVRWPVTITGRILDTKTGKGIAGVGIRSTLLSDRNSLQSIGEAQTDADGHYTVEARPGKVQVQPNVIPKSYLGLWSSELPSLDVTADRTWPDLKLRRAIEVDGVVVDAAGKAVVGAEVFATVPGPTGHGPGGVRTRTGSDGTFHLEQIDPDDALPLRARTQDATTDGSIVIRPKAVEGKLTLTIDPKFAFRIRGRVTDRSGQRIAGARVQLQWTRNYVTANPDALGRGIGGALESCTTSESGWFVFRDLWPGDRYKVMVAGPGWGKAESLEVTGKAGETHDFGTILLAGFNGFLAGHVVGSGGRPIAGATVFNRGDGRREVEDLTDAQGRFRLESLIPGTKYAFARKDGYRFTGIKADSDVDDLTIVLLETTEPPAAWKPGATASFEDQRDFARRVVTRLWEKFGENAEENGASSCITSMARIDPELALQWSADHGHRYDGQVRQAAAEMLAEVDGAEALAMLGPAELAASQDTLQRLADRFAPTDAKRALLFAEEAVVRARALNGPGRTVALARAGMVLVKLGRADAGRKLIDEAAGAASGLGTEMTDGYARGVVAKALTPFDTNRALALLEPFHGNDRYSAFVAASLAEKDPVRAVALTDAMSGNGSYPDWAKTEMASRIGANRPDEAIRIIEGMKSFAAEYMRAEAFAWLAIAVASRDRPRAFTLIDRALASPVDRPRLYESWIYTGGGTASAAHMAAAARQVGYPDMNSVIMRVMTTRPNLFGRPVLDVGVRIRSAAKAAVPLALIDPAAARVFLEQLEARSGLNTAELAEAGGQDWLRAWALVDLKKAEGIFEAQVTAIEKTKDVRLQNTGFFRMIDILVLSAERRVELVFQMDASGRPVFSY